MRKTLIVLVMVYIFFHALIVSQACSTQLLIAQVPPSPCLASNNVVIYNRTNQKVKFSLCPVEGVWEDYALDSGKIESYESRSPGDGQLRIAIACNGKKLQRSLSPRKRYEIFWDSARKVFDIKETVPR